VAGVPEIAKDPRYALNADRVRNRAELVPQLEAIMMTRTKADWLGALEAAKVPCGAINNLAEVFADEHVQARQMVNTWQHPIQPDLKLVASPIKMSRTPVRQDLPPPLLGQHTSDVLGDVLGYSAEQQAVLRSKGVI
jgi:crotonobetainyl-CoA:carnitine CoA-transferase CaiB-like acyl-CoA transferase